MHSFVPENIIQQLKEEEKELQEHTEDVDIVCVDGNNAIRSNVLIEWLIRNFSDLFVDGDKESSGSQYYTRFHRSPEDFILTNKEAISDDIAEAACTFEEVDELECVAEDSKDKAMYNKFQIIANMIKTSGQVAKESSG